MKIRKATVKDIPDLIDLSFNLFKRFEKMDKVDTLDRKYWKSKKQYNDFKKLLKNKKDVFFIAEEKGKIIGYVEGTIFKNYSIFKIKKKGHIETLYITPKYRGKGIGKKLVNELMKWFKARKLKHFTVGTHAFDKGANSFWRYMRFRDYNLKLKK